MGLLNWGSSSGVNGVEESALEGWAAGIVSGNVAVSPVPAFALG